jgi:hypothetical protein
VEEKLEEEKKQRVGTEGMNTVILFWIWEKTKLCFWFLVFFIRFVVLWFLVDQCHFLFLQNLSQDLNVTTAF